MANTVAQKKVREWIVAHWMHETFKSSFMRKDVPLSAGGIAALDAVNEDGTIAAIISTSLAETPSDPVGRGKLSKLRADLYFMILASGVKRRMMIFTEPSMKRLADVERGEGRIPRDIESYLVTITDPTLKTALAQARDRASREMMP